MTSVREVTPGSLADLCERFLTMTAVKIPDPPPWHDDQAPYQGQGWQCVLEMDDRSMTVPFWQGSGHRTQTGMPARPKLRDVMDCLMSDASSAGQTFEQWCGDYGYDTDSRKAYSTWRAIEMQTTALRHLLGARFDQFFTAERD